MSINSTGKEISSAGSFKPTITNTPLDIRTRIATYENYDTIPLPFVGMLVYVEDEDSYYKVKRLALKINEYNEPILNDKGEYEYRIDLMENIAIYKTDNAIIENKDNKYRSKADTDVFFNKMINRINSAGNIIEGIKFIKFSLQPEGNDLYVVGVVGIQHAMGAEVSCDVETNENGMFISNFDALRKKEGSLYSIFECSKLLASAPQDLSLLECAVTVTINGKEYMRFITL